MKKIPLLPSDFKLWSWEKSIGNATDEQVQKAYETLVSQGWTSDFKYVVWNDMVELLYQAITQAGLKWDNTYASIDRTKHENRKESLRAFQFNSVTLNISQLINYTWRWEVDSSVSGFVGRRHFYGLLEKFDKGDFVYGWYIIELARVINLFINILKNQADFGELPCKTIIPMINYCNTRSCEVGALQYDQIIKSITEVNTRGCDSVPLEPQELSKFIEEVNFRNQQGKAMPREYIIKSVPYLNLLPPTGKKIKYIKIINMISNVKAYSRDASPVGLEEHIIDMPNVCDAVNPLGKPMQHEHKINMPYFTNVVGAYSKYFNYENLINVLDSVIVKGSYPKYLNISNIISMIDSVVVVNGYPKYLQGGEISTSISEMNVNTTEGVGIGSDETSNTIDELKVTLKKPSKVIADEVIKTISYFKLSVESTWLYPIKNGTNLYIRQVYSSEQKGNELFIDNDTWLEPIKNGSNLYIRQMYEELNNKED